MDTDSSHWDRDDGHWFYLFYPQWACKTKMMRNQWRILRKCLNTWIRIYFVTSTLFYMLIHCKVWRTWWTMITYPITMRTGWFYDDSLRLHNNSFQSKVLDCMHGPTEGTCSFDFEYAAFAVAITLMNMFIASLGHNGLTKFVKMASLIVTPDCHNAQPSANRVKIIAIDYTTITFILWRCQHSTISCFILLTTDTYVGKFIWFYPNYCRHLCP